jgi:hypothetical protein
LVTGSRLESLVRQTAGIDLSVGGRGEGLRRQAGVSKQEALEKGMEVKSVEFVKQGAEVYHKV